MVDFVQVFVCVEIGQGNRCHWAVSFPSESMEGLQYMESLPLDEYDSTYTKSFLIDESSSALSFFEEHGFVVFRDIYSSEECIETRDAMWSILESLNPGFHRDDQSSWDALKSKGSYGLSMRGPSFHPTLVKNRQNQRLIRALTSIVLPAADDAADQVMVSHDRFAIYRATVLEATRDGGGVIDGSKYTTGEPNIHLDMNPWWWLESSEDVLRGVETLQYPIDEETGAPAAAEHSQASPANSAGDGDVGAEYDGNKAKSTTKKAKKVGRRDASSENQDFIRENNLVVRCMGRHVQCVLNFLPNHAEDGGTLIVPKFHYYLPEFCEKYALLRRPLPWVQFPPEVEAELLKRAHRVTMREGSVLIWDQRVAHGTSPNRSTRCRMAQYLKAFPRSLTFPCAPIPGGEKGEEVQRSAHIGENKVVSQRLLRRSRALDTALRRSGAREVVTPLGELVFGLDVLQHSKTAEIR